MQKPSLHFPARTSEISTICSCPEEIYDKMNDMQHYDSQEKKQSVVLSQSLTLELPMTAETVSKVDDQQLVFDADIIDAALERAGCCDRRRLLATSMCLVAAIANSLSIVCASLAMPAAECDLRLSSVQLGLVNGAGFAGMLAGSLLLGAVSDAGLMSRRGVITLSLSIGAAATLASALAPNFLALMLLCSLIGVGSGGSFPVVMSYYSDWQSRRTRGMAISCFSGCWMLGGMLASSIAWAVLPRPLEWRLFQLGGMSFGAWRVYMLLCSLPYVVSAVAFGLCLPDNPSCLVQTKKSEQDMALLPKVTNNGCHKMGAHDRLAESHLAGTAAFGHLIQLLRPAALVPGFVQASSSGWRRKCPSGGWRGLRLRRARHTGQSDSVRGVCWKCHRIRLVWLVPLGTTAPANAKCYCTLHRLSQIEDPLDSHLQACKPAILLATSPYIEALIVNASNLPGNLALLFLINRVGRRLLLSASLTLMAASVGLIAIVWSHSQAFAFSCTFSATSAIVWNAYNVLAMELLPTGLQASALGLCFALGRLCSLLGSVTFGAQVDAGCLAPMSLSAGVLVLGALLACALPASPHQARAPSAPTTTAADQTATVEEPAAAPAPLSAGQTADSIETVAV